MTASTQTAMMIHVFREIPDVPALIVVRRHDVTGVSLVPLLLAAFAVVDVVFFTTATVESSAKRTESPAVIKTLPSEADVATKIK